MILWCVCAIAGRLSAAEMDIRRDASVEAVQRVMPSVVNVATEEVVPIRDPLENLFRDFFNPYYRNRPPNTQFSLGSGVIIDEEGFVLTNFHVVGRASRGVFPFLIENCSVTVIQRTARRTVVTAVNDTCHLT